MLIAEEAFKKNEPLVPFLQNQQIYCTASLYDPIHLQYYYIHGSILINILFLILYIYYFLIENQSLCHRFETNIVCQL